MLTKLNTNEHISIDNFTVHLHSINTYKLGQLQLGPGCCCRLHSLHSESLDSVPTNSFNCLAINCFQL